METVLFSYHQDNTVIKPIEVDFSALLNTHHDRLYWMIRKIVLVHDDAQDVLQNTWLKIYKGLPGFKGESKIETWMFRIAYNESMRFLKQKKQHYRLDEVDGNYLETIKADTYFNGEESKQALHKALSALKENERHIFNLKYFDDLKFSQVAQLTNTNENTVKTLYYKAEKKIKQHLEK